VQRLWQPDESGSLPQESAQVRFDGVATGAQLACTSAFSNPSTTDKALLRGFSKRRATLMTRAKDQVPSPRAPVPRRTDLLCLAADALQLAGRPMTLTEIYSSVCVVLGRELDRSCLKSVLSANVLCTKPRFRRIRRGIYELR
jgi:hypothetical protein